jgi:hypothetical protein
VRVGPWLACGWTVFVFYSGYWSRYFDTRRAQRKAEKATLDTVEDEPGRTPAMCECGHVIWWHECHFGDMKVGACEVNGPRPCKCTEFEEAEK